MQSHLLVSEADKVRGKRGPRLWVILRTRGCRTGDLQAVKRKTAAVQIGVRRSANMSERLAVSVREAGRWMVLTTLAFRS